uniref:Serine/threonine/dual specificity protein kinase, catalytic domain-containing protein n=1 Tax=Tanacetum cinerariifolium TaxID=118510 RepID=A0A6L2KTJ9_TANCI|nr:serine/threonine/dual specificity protein kinase, catalytic domain-containing protein [Tanacetum cinerariifolium]
MEVWECYKGEYDFQAEIDVEIKRSNMDFNQGAIEFWVEIEILSKFRHSYIIFLLGYCEKTGNREMILVYEYMSNGSPYDHLHKNRANRSNSSPLTWVQILNICVGAARGLDYLHTGTSVQFRVIHHDVKSSNIFLNENLEAKISTLGYRELVLRISHTQLLMFILVRPALDFTLDEQQHRLAGWAKHCIREGHYIGRNWLSQWGGVATVSQQVVSNNKEPKTKTLMKFTYTELRSATRNFWQDSVIGEGGFGKVYKGWLDSITYNPLGADDKLALAVKISKPDSA